MINILRRLVVLGFLLGVVAVPILADGTDPVPPSCPPGGCIVLQ